ncbi:unnamed protein product [Ceratitis capitata]|uniref:(Mediterranean fruit fly) hypothetical protein n=1 Tax=Ceratitis capitata TaxID=7213 RepID=A0A811V7M4_CERCA|nr:unnamed protein product [Ceratitis capitata]
MLVIVEKPATTTFHSFDHFYRGHCGCSTHSPLMPPQLRGQSNNYTSNSNNNNRQLECPPVCCQQLCQLPHDDACHRNGGVAERAQFVD